MSNQAAVETDLCVEAREESLTEMKTKDHATTAFLVLMGLWAAGILFYVGLCALRGRPLYP